MIQITIDTHGLDKLKDAARLDYVWDEVADWGERVIDSNFEEGGRPEKWAAKKKDGQPSFLLVNGELRDSVESLRMADGVEVGYGEEYGIYHRTGTKFMPQRDFGVVTAEDERELGRIVGKALEHKD